METPVFEEFDPASDCDCPGCIHRRRVLPHSPTGRHPAARAHARLAAAAGPVAVIVAAAASAALGAGTRHRPFAAPARTGPARAFPAR